MQAEENPARSEGGSRKLVAERRRDGSAGAWLGFGGSGMLRMSPQGKISLQKLLEVAKLGARYVAPEESTFSRQKALAELFLYP